MRTLPAAFSRGEPAAKFGRLLLAWLKSVPGAVRKLEKNVRCYLIPMKRQAQNAPPFRRRPPIFAIRAARVVIPVDISQERARDTRRLPCLLSPNGRALEIDPEGGSRVGGIGK